MGITLHFPYEPVAQPRPKVSVRNGKGFAYVPSTHKVHNYRNGLAKFARSKFKKPYDGPISVSLTFYLKKAKSNKMDYPCMKPDIDNLAKAVLDALNGIAYVDDKQICKLSVMKKFGDEFDHGVYIYVGGIHD